MPRDTAAEQADARVCEAADERGTRTAGHTCLHRTTFWSNKNQRAMIQRASSPTAGTPKHFETDNNGLRIYEKWVWTLVLFIKTEWGR